MSDNNQGCIVILLYAGTLMLSIGAGVLAWKWVVPNGFWEFVGFLIVWGILSTISHFIIIGLLSLFSKDRTQVKLQKIC